MDRILLFLIIILFVSCEQRKDISMSFNDKEIFKYTGEYSKHGSLPPVNKWNKVSGEAITDSLEIFKNIKSIRLTPSEGDSIKKVEIEYPIDFSDIWGEDLIIKGNYKLRASQEAKISFYIIQSRGLKNEIDSLIIEPSDDSGWKEFYLKSSLRPLSTEAIFTINGEGNVDLLINDCQAWVDNKPLSDLINMKYKAEEDSEFDKGSGIQLGKLTPQMIENLEVLCRVWGFMKYYHPEVTQGNYNWDYELFRILPQVANAKDKSERNLILNKWIDRYDRRQKTIHYVIEDSTKYSRFINLNWINDTEVFDDKMISKLNKIKNAKRNNKFNYYLIPKMSLRENYLYKPFKREKSYEDIKWNDQGFRTLTLFRLWNMIEYCFPYTEYTDSSWGTLIKEFIPGFIFPEDELSYLLAVSKLASKTDDTHARIYFPTYKLSEEPLYPIYRKNTVPVELIQSAEGDIVVKSTQSLYLERGDVIYSINGKEVSKIIEGMSPYIPASNEGGLVRRALRYLLCTDSEEMELGIIRNGKKKSVLIRDFKKNRDETGINSWTAYNLDEKNIIHCYGKKSADETKTMVLENMDSKGFIVDLRIDLINSLMSLPPLLLSDNPLWISINDKSFPGNYVIKPGHNKVPKPIENPKYKGKIVILVDEYTRSTLESWAMWFRTAPNSTVIGRQTAGADGNICMVGLPGDISLIYTQLGAYYPHWEILQRKGIKIDIPVSPTVEDIKRGRDIWIEKAIEIIEEE